ncbi:MAG: FliM/FliN family flagellar motor switch protein [Myxococcales bacterium]|nr:MAG: FliM/FliN family flagellar motor switch protein [Myxococcales bacterium]
MGLFPARYHRKFTTKQLPKQKNTLNINRCELPVSVTIASTEIGASDLKHLALGDALCLGLPWFDTKEAPNTYLLPCVLQTETFPSTYWFGNYNKHTGDLHITAINKGEIMGEAQNKSEERTTHADFRNAPINIRCEMGRFVLPLEDLQRINVGQLIKTGLVFNPKVSLFVADSKIADGELVEIEGQMAVRITALNNPL